VSALMEAVRTENNALIDILMDHHANPALTDGDGHTAADLARARGNAEAIRSLARP
jgi:ankyrin repeat protein